MMGADRAFSSAVIFILTFAISLSSDAVVAVEARPGAEQAVVLAPAPAVVLGAVLVELADPALAARAAAPPARAGSLDELSVQLGPSERIPRHVCHDFLREFGRREQVSSSGPSRQPGAEAPPSAAANAAGSVIAAVNRSTASRAARA
jgi:hypothetical protein